MQIVWLVILVLIVQQQPVKQLNPVLNANKDEYIELNTDSLVDEGFCVIREYPFVRELSDIEHIKNMYMLSVTIINNNFEERQALLSAKKAANYVSKFIQVSNIAKNKEEYFYAIGKLGTFYIFLANDQIEGNKSRLIRTLTPKVLNVLFNELKSSDRRLKEQALEFLYCIAQTNNKYRVLDDSTRLMVLLQIRENIFPAQYFGLGIKVQQTYNEFLK